jgi:hypothetical protein
MGMVREDTAAGLYAGERSGRSGLGAFARQTQSDQKRKLSDGSTIPQRVAARSAERQLRQAQQPTALQRIEQAATYVGSAEMADDLSGAGDALIGGVQSARSRAAQGAARVGQGVVQVAQTATNPERLGDVAAAAMTGIVDAIHTHDVARRPEARTGMAVRQLPGSNRLAWLPRQTPPTHAKTIAATNANRAHLLATGYTIQDGNTPETLLIWQDAPTNPPTSRRTGLVQAGNIAFRASPLHAHPPAVPVARSDVVAMTPTVPPIALPDAMERVAPDAPIVPAASSAEAIHGRTPALPATPTPADDPTSIPTQTPRRGAI